MILQVGVKVIIRNDKDEILLLRRTMQYLLPADTSESWDIPGGRIETGEKLDAALAREVQEETGVRLKGSPTLLIAQDIIVPTKDLHVVRLTYVHTQELGDIVLSDEHDAFKWVPVSDAKRMSIEPFLKAAIESLS